MRRASGWSAACRCGCSSDARCAAQRGHELSIEIGKVEALFRYPVKSMGGERLEVAELGWYGIDGDRGWRSGG